MLALVIVSTAEIFLLLGYVHLQPGCELLSRLSPVSPKPRQPGRDSGWVFLPRQRLYVQRGGSIRSCLIFKGRALRTECHADTLLPLAPFPLRTLLKLYICFSLPPPPPIHCQAFTRSVYFAWKAFSPVSSYLASRP